MLQKRKQKRVQKAAHGTRVSRECVTLVCDKYEIHGVKTSPATLYTGYYGMSTRYRCGHYGMFPLLQWILLAAACNGREWGAD